MPESDKRRLQESFQTFVANYDKVNIHVEPVFVAQMIELNWQRYLMETKHL